MNDAMASCEPAFTRQYSSRNEAWRLERLSMIADLI